MKKSDHPGYKYRLKYLFDQGTKQSFDYAMIFLPQRLRIHRQTLRRWIYTPADSHFEIPAAALLKLAVFFDREPIELLTDRSEIEKFDQEWRAFFDSKLNT